MSYASSELGVNPVDCHC